jgi:hypothetical protein
MIYTSVQIYIYIYIHNGIYRHFIFLDMIFFVCFTASDSHILSAYKLCAVLYEFSLSLSSSALLRALQDADSDRMLPTELRQSVYFMAVTQEAYLRSEIN